MIDVSLENILLSLLIHRRKHIQQLKKHLYFEKLIMGIVLKGIFSDSNNIILRHELEDKNKKNLFPKLQLIPIYFFKLGMIMCVSLLP